MKLMKAISTKNKNEVKNIVAKAVKIYNGTEPVAREVNTAFGDMDIRMLDNKSKWHIARSELAQISRAVKCIPESADNRVETAKIIANSQLRILFDSFDSDNEFI